MIIITMANPNDNNHDTNNETNDNNDNNDVFNHNKMVLMLIHSI